MTNSNDSSPILLAYSGGLDTSFCVPWLKETYGRPVITACVNTGGLDAAAVKSLADRAMALGASEHAIFSLIALSNT
jgi:argininosuccinate synthase